MIGDAGRDPSRRHHRSPASASSRRGRIPDSQLPQDDDTTARFAAECQSFLRPSSMPCLSAPDSELCPVGLITVWLPVRVLPAPPRSPALTPNSPSPRNTLALVTRFLGFVLLSCGHRSFKEVEQSSVLRQLAHLGLSPRTSVVDNATLCG